MSKKKQPEFRMLHTIEDCHAALEEIKSKWKVLKQSRKVPYEEFIDGKLKNLKTLIKKNKNPALTPIIAMPLVNEFFNCFLIYDLTLEAIMLCTQASDKLKTFIKYQNQMSDQECWKFLHDNYVLQDFASFPETILIKLFQSDRPGKEHLMSEEDREIFDNLPDEFTIYRAMSKKEYDSGKFRLSWTLNKTIANTFLERNSLIYGHDGLVHEIKIKKSQAIAYFNIREEEEIIYIQRKK